MLTRTHYDYSKVAPEHKDIHARLENWGAWSRACTSALGSVHPMFRQYRSAQHWERGHVSDKGDPTDALVVERGLSGMRIDLKRVLAWAYIRCDSPRKFAETLDTDAGGLWHLLQAARSEAASRLCK